MSERLTDAHLAAPEHFYEHVYPDKQVRWMIDELRFLRAEREECYVAASEPAWGGPLEESAVAAIRKTLPTTGALMRRAMSEIRTMATELRMLRQQALTAEEIAELRAFKVGMNYEGLHDDHQGMRVICRLLGGDRGGDK